MPKHDVSVTSDDGLTLHVSDWQVDQQTGNLPVVCLAGLTRNSRDFDLIAARITTDPDHPRRVLAPDYRGRGRSDHDPEPSRYTVLREALDVVAMLDQLGIDKAHVIGTSRGGLIIHVLAELAPQRLGGLVFNDVGPVIERDGLRHIAAYLAKRPAPASWEDAAAMLAATHGQAFPVFGAADWTDMAHALFSDRDGTIKPDYDPALVMPLLSMDFSQPLPDLWAQFDKLANHPMLVIRGEHSSLLTQASVEAMMARAQKATALTASGQGHAPNLHGRDVEPALMQFLANLD